MLDLAKEFGFALSATDHLELSLADLSLARALFDGVPAARLLARTRLGRDERDLVDPETALVLPRITYDLLLHKWVPEPDRRAELGRAVARHTRAAMDEGAISASDSVVAALIRATALASDPDASLSEIVSSSDASAEEAFEACVHLASLERIGPWPVDRMLSLVAQVEAIAGNDSLVRSLPSTSFPRALEPSTQPANPRIAILDRAPFDALVARDPRDLAATIARKSSSDRASVPPPSPAVPPRASHTLDSFVSDLMRMLRRSGALVLAAVPARDLPGADDSGKIRPPRSPSWLPQDWSSPRAAAAIAEALELRATTLPRVRLVVAHGGDDALEAVGSEMLKVAAHPFASAAFAEIVASNARPRDVMRLVTYFALAPDPTIAARALGSCRAQELPRVLRTWFESLLPSDGGLAAAGDDPDRSSGARLTAWVSALQPYPHLYDVVAPLLRRVSDHPPKP